MAVFTHITPDAAAEWARLHFGVAAADALSPIAEGIENTNYLLSAGERRFVLTVFEIWDAEMTDYYASLMRHLAARGAPVPAPLCPQNAAGERWKDKPALLSPFVEGEWRRNPDAAECRKMGAVVAGLHLAAADFTQKMANPRNAEWRRQTVAQLNPKLPPDTRDILHSALAEDARFYDLPLPAGACHCDLFRNNVLWRDGEIAGVIDFYFGGDDALIFDLAVCICDWCFIVGENADGAHLDSARLRALMEGYESRRPLCDLERARFDDAMRSAALRFWISRLYDIHFPREAKFLAPHDPRQFENIYRRTRRAPILEEINA